MSNLKTTITTQDLNVITKNTDNIYKSVSIIAKRAKQITRDSNDDLKKKLAEFSMNEELEDYSYSKEHILLVKAYEKNPNSFLLSLEEFLGNKITYNTKEPVI